MENKIINNLDNNDIKEEKITEHKRGHRSKAKLLKTDKKDILVKIAKGNKTIENIAKEYNISKQYVSQLKCNNRIEYEAIVNKINEQVRLKAISVSDRALSAITAQKLKASSAIALANVAKIGSDITHKPQQIVNIDINIGDSRQDNLRFILDGEIIDNNESYPQVNNVNND